jgi:hypothetical protein
MTESSFFEAADKTMDWLESDGSMRRVLLGARRVLGRLEVDPNDPRLRTRTFSTEGYGHVRATPIGVDDWYVFWRPAENDDDGVVIINLGPAPSF